MGSSRDGGGVPRVHPAQHHLQLVGQLSEGAAYLLGGGLPRHLPHSPWPAMLLLVHGYPNYIYLKLRMLGPNGVITIQGSFD